MKQNGYRTLRLGMKRYVNKFNNLYFKVKLIGTYTDTEEIRNLEISDRETEDIRITFNQVIKDLKLGQKR